MPKHCDSLIKNYRKKIANQAGLILPAHDIVLVGARSAQVKMQLDQYVDLPALC
jgi:hypothetical protein